MRQSDDIGEVVFAFGIVRAHLAQPAQHVCSGGAENTGIAQRLGAFRLRRVDPFDNALNVAAACDHPTVAGRVGRAESEQGQRRIAGGATVQQMTQRLRVNKWRVSVQDRHLAVAEMRRCAQGSVCGAEALLLHDADVGGGLPLQGVHVRSDNHDDTVEHRFAARHQVAQHGATGDLVQRLGQRGLHARSDTCGQDHRGACHTIPRYSAVLFAA